MIFGRIENDVFQIFLVVKHNEEKIQMNATHDHQW